MATANPSSPDKNSVPPRRVVLLGASNLTRGVSTVLETAFACWGRPLQVFAALGHGRSYGMTSRVLIRTLPGIAQCGLWRDLEASPPVPTAALLTDIGNDLLYETPVARIADWIEQSLDRLQAHDAAIVLTLLPTCNLDRLSNLRFRFFRQLFMPGCGLSLAEVRHRSHELNERLLSLADSRNVTAVAQRPDWYGMDPIHIKSRRWNDAWPEILGAWRHDTAAPPVTRAPLFRWAYLRSLPPEQRWLLRREQRKQQPAGKLRDGSTIGFY